jgi:hypothetical protein
MACLAGSIVTIKRAPYPNRFRIKGSGYYWSEEMFEPICDNSIYISCDGNTVKAELKQGDEVVKVSEAKCSPDDKFDFAIGAKLAFDRIFEPIRFKFEDFKKGKIAVNCKSEADAKLFLAYLHGKGLKWSSGHALTSFINWPYGDDTCYTNGNDGVLFGDLPKAAHEKYLNLILP